MGEMIVFLFVNGIDLGEGNFDDVELSGDICLCKCVVCVDGLRGLWG